VQKVIAKYGLAAHLALLAVAPLFLYPFVGETSIAVVLLWLSLPAAVWTIFEPSVRSGESTGMARQRVMRAIGSDPLFWMSLALVVMFGVWALNTGISLAYDAEKSQWSIAEPVFPILPGAVGVAGFLPFACSVALMVILQGCRHSLGRLARMAFLLIAAFLSGVAGAVVLLRGYFTHSGVHELCNAAAAHYSYAGYSHGLLLLAAIVALAAAFERGWHLAVFALIVAIGGNAATLFILATNYQVTAFVAVLLVLVAVAFVYCHYYGSTGADFKFLVVAGLSLTLGGLLVATVLSSDALDARIAEFQSLSFFSEKFWSQRTLLSAIALKSWFSHLWTGTGVASFAFDFRFNATDVEWAVMPLGVKAVPNGWWFLLAERGLVGTGLYLVPFGFLVFTYVRRAIDGVWKRQVPHPAILLGPLAFVLLVADGFFDCTPLRVEVILVTGTMLAVSAASISRGK